jgi:cell division FtsZ-interacting protein ZapD
MNETTDLQAWLAEEIEREKDECRRIAKRDGVPLEAIEALFEKMSDLGH